MHDAHKQKVRTSTMSKIRKTNTKPEMLVRSYLFKNGFRFRIHVKRLPGNPDIVLPKYRTVVFVNGCFWHAHEGCKLNRMPKSRQEYWIPKIQGNASRDKANKEAIEQLGWKVIVIWECELASASRDKTLDELKNIIKHKI